MVLLFFNLLMIYQSILKILIIFLLNTFLKLFDFNIVIAWPYFYRFILVYFTLYSTNNLFTCKIFYFLMVKDHISLMCQNFLYEFLNFYAYEIILLIYFIIDCRHQDQALKIYCFLNILYLSGNFFKNYLKKKLYNWWVLSKNLRIILAWSRTLFKFLFC
jgi:hypothetical protein